MTHKNDKGNKKLQSKKIELKEKCSLPSLLKNDNIEPCTKNFVVSRRIKHQINFQAYNSTALCLDQNACAF